MQQGPLRLGAARLVRDVPILDLTLARREEFCPYAQPDQALNLDDASPRTYKLLNSGVVALRPSRVTFDALVDLLQTSPNVAEWLCPDQDLMSELFDVRGRRVLPLSYNAIKTARHWSVARDLRPD